MNEANTPFKNFRVLWFPFSVPATLLGMAAWLVFYFANVLFAWIAGVESASVALDLFGRNVASSILAFSHARVAPGTGWLFAAQCLTALVIWATLGISICRCIALRIARDEYIGMRDAVLFAFKNSRTAVLYPVIIGSCMLLLAGINFVIGTLMQVPWIGLLFFLLLPIAYVVAAFMLVIGLSGLFGMGLVSGAIAVERRGTLDAWGKALNYIFARPIQCIIYLVVTKVFLVDIVAHYAFEEQILHRWTRTSLVPIWSNTRFESYFADNFEPAGYFDRFARFLAQGASGFVAAFLAGLVISFTLAAFTSMFLILRRDVDGIDTSDIEYDGPPLEEPAPLPVQPATAKVEEPAAPSEPPSVDPRD